MSISRLKKLPRTLLRPVLAIGAAAALAGGAYADGTDAGTEVENTFVLNYEVNSVAQAPITNDPASGITGAVVQGAPTLFTVDRLVDLTVLQTNSPLTVTPGATGVNAQLSFTVTNTGNDAQSYSFSLADVGGDDFDATGLTISYQIAGGAIVTVPAVVPGTAATTDHTPDIPPDTPFTVFVSGTIPTTQVDTDFDDLILVAETRDPVTWLVEGASTTEGNVTLAETGANDLVLAAQNVLADGTGTTEEVDNDGLFSAQARFIIESPDLAAAKTVAVVATEPADCETDTILTTPAQFATPGSCIEYVITVENTGATALASNVEIVDVLPAEVEFIAASFAGFEAAPVPSLTVPGSPTTCDGTDTTCSVDVSGGSIAAGNTATLTIRAIVQ
ncbi:MAG: hypothetical protein ABJG15_09470 [Hyphomonadaceae bacterium]